MLTVRRAQLTFAALLAAFGVGAPAALASTPVGRTMVPTTFCPASPDYEIFNSARADGVSTVVPSAGVLTSWSFQASLTATTVTLRVFRPTNLPDVYYIVGEGGPMVTVPADALVHTYPRRLAVQAGDIIGLRASGTGLCQRYTGNAGDVVHEHNATAVPPGSAEEFTMTSTSYQIDVAATLEADADHDGYGDDTQDACPQSALTQAVCPAPQTRAKVKGHPRAAKTRIELSSSVSGSTFSCTLDKKAAKACGPKVVYRCLKPGRHRLYAVATSPLGIVDPTPASVKLRIARTVDHHPGNRKRC